MGIVFYRFSSTTNVTKSYLLNFATSWATSPIAQHFSDAIGGVPFLELQSVPEGYRHSWWAFCAILKTDKPQVDWYKLRDKILSDGGDGVYAAWKLSYMEPFFQQTVQHQARV